MNKQERIRVWLKYNKHCAYCGKILEYKDMQVDHLVPKCLRKNYNKIGREKQEELKGVFINSFENLMPSCRRCNHYKRALSLEEFRTQMKTMQYRLLEIYIMKVAVDYGIIEIKKFDGVFYFEKWKVVDEKEDIKRDA